MPIHATTPPYPQVQVLEAYMHSHADMLHDAWLFQGSPEQVFSDVGAVCSSRNTMRYGQGTIREIQVNIRARQRMPHAANISCAYMLNTRVEMVEIDGHLEPFYRKARCMIDLAVREWVMVVMHRPRRAVGKDDWPTRYMHAAVRVYYA